MTSELLMSKPHEKEDCGTRLSGIAYLFKGDIRAARFSGDVAPVDAVKAVRWVHPELLHDVGHTVDGRTGLVWKHYIRWYQYY